MNERLKICEVYPTLSTAGKNQGKSVIVVRLFGNNYADRNDSYRYASDTSSSQSDKFKENLTFKEVEDLIGKFRNGHSINLVFCGGEALLQMVELISFIKYLKEKNIFEYDITVETNGLIKPIPELNAVVDFYQVNLKLSNSSQGNANSTFSQRIDKPALDMFVADDQAYFCIDIKNNSDLDELRDISKMFKIDQERIWLRSPSTDYKSLLGETSLIWKNCVNSKYNFSGNHKALTFGQPKFGITY